MLLSEDLVFSHGQMMLHEQEKLKGIDTWILAQDQDCSAKHVDMLTAEKVLRSRTNVRKERGKHLYVELWHATSVRAFGSLRVGLSWAFSNVRAFQEVKRVMRAGRLIWLSCISLSSNAPASPPTRHRSNIRGIR